MEKIDVVLSKDEMYKMIWIDYFDCPKSERAQSFIYRYMKNNKTRQCIKLSSNFQALKEYGNQKKFDKYILLKSTRLAYENKISGRDYFIEILAYVTGINMSEYVEKGDEELFDLSVKQEEKLLMGCITDFFHNKGYRFKKKDTDGDSGKIKDETEKMRASEEYEKVEPKYSPKQDGYMNDLDLWADFYLYKKNKGQTVSGTLDGIMINDDYIEKCEKLYSELLAEGQTDVFVPLCFDAKSGAGIYIIGSDTGSIPDDRTCCIFVSCFFYVDNCDYQNEELYLSMQFKPVDSIRDAFDLFRRGGSKFFQHYPNENGNMPASADECFNVFFDKTVPVRTEKLVEKLIERENADITNMKLLKYTQSGF